MSPPHAPPEYFEVELGSASIAIGAPSTPKAPKESDTHTDEDEGGGAIAIAPERTCIPRALQKPGFFTALLVLFAVDQQMNTTGLLGASTR